MQCRVRGGRLGCGSHELVEPVDVGLPQLDAPLVAALTRDEPGLAERLPKAGDVDLDALPGRLRRLAGPDLVDETIRGHGATAVEQQDGEKGSLLRAAEGNRLAVVVDLERSEQAELHRAPSGSPRTVFRSSSRRKGQ